MVSVWDVTKRVAWATSPIFPMLGLVIDAAEKAAGAVDLASDKSFDALKEEVAKQEIRLKFELQQAQIAQELAIAQRILSAETVEIEEFYDRSGNGKLGVQVDGKNATIGLAADGKSVTKRIYKFVGRHDIDNDNPAL